MLPWASSSFQKCSSSSGSDLRYSIPMNFSVGQSASFVGITPPCLRYSAAASTLFFMHLQHVGLLLGRHRCGGQSGDSAIRHRLVIGAMKGQLSTPAQASLHRTRIFRRKIRPYHTGRKGLDLVRLGNPATPRRTAPLRVFALVAGFHGSP